MGDLASDTAVEGIEGRYCAELSRDWDIWGPNGGYLAVIALRAAGAQAKIDFPNPCKPASITCQYLNVAKFGGVDLEVKTLRSSKRAAAYLVYMKQKELLVLSALVWVIDASMNGLMHNHTRMPDVPGPDTLYAYSELVSDYEKWYPFWNNFDARPVKWVENDQWQPGIPEWALWYRYVPTSTFKDNFLDAGRSLLWLDTGMWPAAWEAHGVSPYIAPNLDVSAQFHSASPNTEWLLCDSISPFAAEGLVGCNSRIWSPDGLLLASAGGQLFCRPNPEWNQNKK